MFHAVQTVPRQQMAANTEKRERKERVAGNCVTLATATMVEPINTHFIYDSHIS